MGLVQLCNNYTCRRGSDGGVVCTVQRDSERPRSLESVGYHSECFEMGYGGSGAADLALTILLDHLEVPVADARRSYRGGFRTADVRVLKAWMAHHRLKEQRISSDKNYVEVNEWELNRLLMRKFLTEDLEKAFDKARIKREKEECARARAKKERRKARQEEAS